MPCQGVAEVASIGGFVRQYQIEVDSQKMRALGVSLEHVMEAVEPSNLNVGGKTIEENGMEFIVRGVGLVKSVADLEEDRAGGAGRHADLSARTSRASRSAAISAAARWTWMAAKWWAASSSCAPARTPTTSSGG